MVTPRDCRIHKYFVKQSAPDLADIEEVWAGLRVGLNYIDPADLAGRSGAEDGEPDRMKALALHYLDQVGALRRRRDFVLRGRISVVEDTARLLEELRTGDPELAGRAEGVLGSTAERTLDYDGLAACRRLGMAPGRIEAVLFELQKRDICGFAAVEVRLDVRASHRCGAGLEPSPTVDPSAVGSSEQAGS